MIPLLIVVVLIVLGVVIFLATQLTSNPVSNTQNNQTNTNTDTTQDIVNSDVTNVFNSTFDIATTKWRKVNTTVPNPSDNLSTEGRLAKGKSGGDMGAVKNGTVIKDGDLYRMWYSGSTDLGNSNRQIYYAFSFDGYNWVKYDNSEPAVSDTVSTNGRIGFGTKGKGDDRELANPEVVKVNGKYYMWYMGVPSTGEFENNYLVFLATSNDGLTWTKVDNTIPARSDTTSTNGRLGLAATPGRAEHISSIPGVEVVYKDNQFYMWYVSGGGTYLATSPDGLTWTKYNNQMAELSDTTSTDGRIPQGTAGKGDSGSSSLAAVFYSNNKFYAMYAGNPTNDGNNRHIFCAESTDGLTWTKLNNTIPTRSDSVSTDCRLPAGTTTSSSANGLNMIDIIVEDNKAKLYYLGISADGGRMMFMAESF